MLRDHDGSIRPLSVVVNPVAGRGRSRARGEALRRALDAAGIEHRCVVTKARGDAERAAATADGPVVVVGGDGTVHEVLNGLGMRDGVLGPLAVLPSGSGDDFAAGAGFAADPEALVARLASGVVRAVDCGEVALTTVRGTSVRRFANDLGVGFEADVVRATRGLPLRGRALYLAATLRALLRQRAFGAELSLDGAASRSHELLFATFCNGPRVGGGLPFAPHAANDDGRLELLEVAATTRAGTLALLGKLLRRRHLADARVRATSVAAATLRCSRPVAVAMDGELAATDAVALDVRVLAGRLFVAGYG